jgi:hypothetical protein
MNEINNAAYDQWKLDSIEGDQTEPNCHECMQQMILNYADEFTCSNKQCEEFEGDEDEY